MDPLNAAPLSSTIRRRAHGTAMGLRLGLVTMAALGVLPFGGRAMWFAVVLALGVLLGVLVAMELRAKRRADR